jgi:hypothetical protein
MLGGQHRHMQACMCHNLQRTWCVSACMHPCMSSLCPVQHLPRHVHIRLCCVHDVSGCLIGHITCMEYHVTNKIIDRNKQRTDQAAVPPTGPAIQHEQGPAGSAGRALQCPQHRQVMTQCLRCPPGRYRQERPTPCRHNGGAVCNGSGGAEQGRGEWSRQ